PPLRDAPQPAERPERHHPCDGQVRRSVHLTGTPPPRGGRKPRDPSGGFACLKTGSGILVAMTKRDILAHAKPHYEEDQLLDLDHAIDFATESHKGQKR